MADQFVAQLVIRCAASCRTGQCPHEAVVEYRTLAFVRGALHARWHPRCDEHPMDGSLPSRRPPRAKRSRTKRPA